MALYGTSDEQATSEYVKHHSIRGVATITYDEEARHYFARFSDAETLKIPVGASLIAQLQSVMIDAQGTAPMISAPWSHRIHLVRQHTLQYALRQGEPLRVARDVSCGRTLECQYEVVPGPIAKVAVPGPDEILMEIPQGKLRAARRAFEKHGWRCDLACKPQCIDDAVE